MNDQPVLAPLSPEERVDPNKHIREYLSYYIELQHAPHYAVLLTGVWGIGKTFLIRQILNDYYKNRESKYIYLSLYGLSSYEDLDRALRNAIFPILDNKAAVVGTKVVKAALEAVKVRMDLNWDDFTTKFKDALYVFDDLERCALPMQKVMGYINQFVEHDRCKVVIVANEEAIKEQLEYRERREKTVGQVLEVQSSIDDALTYFLTKIKDVETKEFLRAKSNQIIDLFAQSNLRNLRVLQQTLWDFERLHKLIAPKSRNCEAGMRVLLNLLFALSFDVKSGKLTAQDIDGRHDYKWSSFTEEKKEDKQLTKMEKSIRRYSRIDLTDPIFSNEILKDILFKGLLRSEAINGSLVESHHFQEPAEQLPWLVVWNHLEIYDAAFFAALKKMELQFSNHEFVIPGEVLHVFGLRLWSASERFLDIPRTQAIEEGIAYVDHLFKNGKLDNLDPDSPRSSWNNYAGLSYQESESDDFKKLASYFAEKRNQARVNQYPALGEEILADMRKNADIFSKIALQRESPGPYLRIPVLATIKPSKFAQTWVDMEPSAQKDVAVALNVRYESGGLSRELEAERSWLQTVKTEVEMLTADKHGPTQLRFRWFGSAIFDKYLPQQ